MPSAAAPQNPPAMPGFAAASLAPVALLLLGLAGGSAWFAAALVYLTAWTVLADRLAPRRLPDARPDAPGITAQPAAAPDPDTGPDLTPAPDPDTDAQPDAAFPASDALLVTLGLAHLVLMALAVRFIGGPGEAGPAARLLAFMAFGLHFGQVSNPAAHELIHSRRRALHRLGTAVYVTLLFGHHASAHRLVHHVHVATAADPNTARRGESFYAFAPRAWIGSFRAGRAAEAARPRKGPHPYLAHGIGTAACLVLAATLGPGGVLAWVALALHATAQLLLSDYVQHYGLVRARLPDGRVEPVSARHAWNAAQPFSAALMLNAPRHSDHHSHPGRAYPALGLPEAGLVLPRSLPVMAAAALVPPLWRRMMDPRLAAIASRERDVAGAGAGRAGVAG